MGNGRLRWDDVEIFCLLAEFGSIRRTAAHCDQSIETVRRRINALEVSIGERLFRRTAHGLAITQAGLEILAEARRARDAIRSIARLAGADRPRTERVVRLSAPEDVGAFWLLPTLHRGHRDGAGCAVRCELRSAGARIDWETCDVAILDARPDNPDLICRRIGVVRYAFYGKRAFFTEEELGPDAGSLPEAPLILPGESHPYVERLACDDRWRDRLSRPRMRVDSAAATLNILSAAKSIGILPTFASRDIPWLAQLPERAAPICEVELWIAFHDDVRHSPSAGALLDFLVSSASANPDLRPHALGAAPLRAPHDARRVEFSNPLR